jgi:adenylylsulfate kinase
MHKKVTSPPALELSKNLMRYIPHITRRDRNLLNQHGSGLLWFTGLPAAGKSTIAHELEKRLLSRNIRAYVLDGDNVRQGINADLGFSRQDRKENIRRTVEISKLLIDAGLIVLASFVSPYQDHRDYVRSCFSNGNFYEVYMKCSLKECERRDPKGMYKKARMGIIEDYTGISSPYEEPESPDLIIDTEETEIEDAIQTLLHFLDRVQLLNL